MNKIDSLQQLSLISPFEYSILQLIGPVPELLPESSGNHTIRGTSASLSSLGFFFFPVARGGLRGSGKDPQLYPDGDADFSCACSSGAGFFTMISTNDEPLHGEYMIYTMPPLDSGTGN